VQIVDPPKPTKVILGLTATLTCGVKASAGQKYTLQWLFNRQPIPKTGRIQELSDGSLQIEQARNTDVGVYTCKVASEFSSDTQSARLDLVEIPHPPRHVRAQLFPNSALVNVSWTPPFDGNSAILKYIVQSRIIPNYHETGNDAMVDVVPFVDVPVNVSASQTFALISDLRPAMTYQFRLVAVNEVGKGQPSAATTPPVTLPAQPPSLPPIGVVGAARSSTTIYIQWQPPALEGHNGQLYGYRVRYKLAGYHSIPWIHRNITNAGQLSYILDDLIVWKNYEIQVGAYNEVGVGVYSPSIYIRTKEGKPESAPSQVNAQAISSTSIQVGWKSPDPQLVNGINQGYKIRAFNTFDNSTKELHVEPHSLPDTEQTAMLHNLEPFTEYMINVLCYTSAGEGPPNEPSISAKTLQGQPGEVAAFRFHNVLHNSLDVEWEPPKRINGELIAYTLKYAALDSLDNTQPEWKVLNFSQNVLHSSISHLQSQTDYRFELNAWTQVGAGPAKVVTVRSGIPPVLPSPPAKLAISNIGPTSVVLQFTTGFNGNSSILRYLVEAQRSGFGGRAASIGGSHGPAELAWTQIYESENVSQPDAITVHSLKPFTSYRLRLVPVNIVGRSEKASDPSPPFQTFQAPPAHAPQNVSTQSFNPTSILVTWSALSVEAWNGEPRGYNVTWRMLSDEPHFYESSLKPQWFTIPYTQRTHLITGLKNVTDYAVQVQAINDVGASPMSRPLVQRTSDRILPMPSNLQLRTRLPFYFERWFVAGVAAFMLLSTCLLVGALCMQNSKAPQYKQPTAQAVMQVAGKFPPMHGSTLQGHGSRAGHHVLRVSQDQISDGDFGLDEMGDAAYLATGHQSTNAIAASHAGVYTLRSNSNGHGVQRDFSYRRAAGASAMAGPSGQLARAKCPPRPAPGSLTYSDDEDEDTKQQMYGSSSGSCSEKPSESSSAADSDSDREDDDLAANRHFVNHYANVNDTLKKGHSSWKKQAHAYVVRSQRDLPSSTVYGTTAGPSGMSQTAVSIGALNHLGHGGPVAGPSGLRNANSQQTGLCNSGIGPSSNTALLSDSSRSTAGSASAINARHSPMSVSNAQMLNNSIAMNTSIDMNMYGRNQGTTNRSSPMQNNANAAAMMPPPSQPPPPSYSQLQAEDSELDSPAINLNGGRIVVNNMAGSRAPLPGFSSFV
jgi:hypothetical protein